MDNKEPLVSVIMNCFNGETFLKDAIDSVLQQTYKNFEVIFWDNQSTDNSANILKSFKDKRIKYYYAEKHTNLGEARKEALKKASGEWISFLDVDDLWLPEKLESQIKVGLSDNLCGLIYSDVKIDFYGVSNNNHPFKKSEYRIKKQYAASPLKYLFRTTFIPWPSIMVRHKFLLASGGISGYAFSVDYDLELKLAINYNVLHIDKILCIYRQHANNLSLSTNLIGFIECVEIIKKYKGHKYYGIGLACHNLKLIAILFKKRKFRETLKQISNLFLDNSAKEIVTAIIFLFSHIQSKC